jgi:hypothetical protein
MYLGSCDRRYVQLPATGDVHVRCPLHSSQVHCIRHAYTISNVPPSVLSVHTGSVYSSEINDRVSVFRRSIPINLPPLKPHPFLPPAALLDPLVLLLSWCLLSPSSRRRMGLGKAHGTRVAATPVYMYSCVCLHVCIDVSVYLCIRVRVCACVCVYIYAWTLGLCVCMYMRVCRYGSV